LISILHDIKNIKSSRKDLREFGITIGVVLLVIAAFASCRARASYSYFLAAGAFFIFGGFFFPAVLKPFQKVWMGFSVVMGFFMSRLILAILFYAVITPIGFITKLCGKDVLDERISKEKKTYWQPYHGAAKTKESYENQY